MVLTNCVKLEKETRRNHMFNVNQGEGFSLWKSRTQASLVSKELWDVVENNAIREKVSGNEDTEAEAPLGLPAKTKLKMSKAREVIIQVLGTKQLKFCLEVKDSPHRKWKRLEDCYAITNVTTKVQLQSRLKWMVYNGTQSVYDYI